MNIQDWFSSGLTGWPPCRPRDPQESSPALQFKNISSSVLSLLYGPTLTFVHDCMTTVKIIALTIQTFVSKMMSLLFSMLFRFAIAFVLRSKCLLISWPRSAAQEILLLFPLLFALMWWDQMTWSLFFECWISSQLFHSPLSSSSKGSLVTLYFLPLEWYHLHIWGCWYFFQQSWF